MSRLKLQRPKACEKTAVYDVTSLNFTGNYKRIKSPSVLKHCTIKQFNSQAINIQKHLRISYLRLAGQRFSDADKKPSI